MNRVKIPAMRARRILGAVVLLTAAGVGMAVELPDTAAEYVVVSLKWMGGQVLLWAAVAAVVWLVLLAVRRRTPFKRVLWSRALLGALILFNAQAIPRHLLDS